MASKDKIPAVIDHVVVKEVLDRLPNDPEMYLRLSGYFRVLGDPTRLRIVMALCAHEMCVSDIAATLEMEHSAISHQLRVLSDHKMVKSHKSGKVVYYSLTNKELKRSLHLGFDHITN